ncbi:MAG: GNAT family N-acetyltransferase [Vicinamibacterales bacterium]
MVTLHAAPTDALTAPFLYELRHLLNTAFAGDFTDEDWDSTIGGVHVWLIDSSEIISHAALIERTLMCSGQTLRVGYVEAVATVATKRRKGHGARVMNRINELVRNRYRLGALSSGTPAFYATLGWERWHGPTFVNGARGRERTPDDDGSIMILRTSRSPDLDLDGEIVCDWRRGDVW